MIKKKNVKKTLFILSIIFLLLLGLFFTDGQYWILSCLGLWIVLSFIIYCIIEFCSYELFFPWLNQKLERLSKSKIFKKHTSKKDSKKDFSSFNGILYKYVLPILITVLIITPFLTVHMSVLTQWKADQNISECERIAFQSIDCAFTNESKAEEILVFFDEHRGNMYNAYRMKDQYLFALDEGRIKFYATYPFIAVRTYSDDHPCWMLTSEFGHCGEYANLYRYMCHQIGLEVRKVCTDGEDHCWNEVYINDTIGWKLVDATTVSLSEGKNGYDNVNKSWMKQKLGGNLSHVAAQGVNGEYVDITNNYTTVVNVTVKTSNVQGYPVSDAVIKVFSHNRYEEERFTKIKGRTDNNGEYTFSIGVGNYTIKAQKDGLRGINSSIISNDDSTISISIQ